jgi:hypothetical protein
LSRAAPWVGGCVEGRNASIPASQETGRFPAAGPRSCGANNRDAGAGAAPVRRILVGAHKKIPAVTNLHRLQMEERQVPTGAFRTCAAVYFL